MPNRIDPREIPNPYDETEKPFVGGGEFNYMYIDRVTSKPTWASAAEEQELKDGYKKKFGEYAHDELRRTHIRTNDTTRPRPDGEGWARCESCHGEGETEHDVQRTDVGAVAVRTQCMDCEGLGYVREPDDTDTEPTDTEAQP